MSDTKDGEPSPNPQEWSEEELQDLLKAFMRHVVGITMFVQDLDESGQPVGDERFFCFSGFVVALGESWWLVTAGHIIKDTKRGIDAGKIRVDNQALVDYCGKDEANKNPLPFSVTEAIVIYVDDRELKIDFALIPIPDLIQKNLEANKVKPLKINPHRRFDYDDLYGFGVVGFPSEYVTPVTDPKEPRFGARVRPVLVPLKRIDDQPQDGLAPRFVGMIIEMANQKSIDGMSGGPIFGYSKGREEEAIYEVVAIQSSWNEKDKVYGCPFSVVFPTIKSIIEEGNQRREKLIQPSDEAPS